MVACKFVGEVNLKLADKKVSLEFSEEAFEWVAKNSYEEAYRSRPIERLVQDKFKKSLTDHFLFGSLEKSGLVKVGVKDDKLDFKFPEN